MDEKFMQRYRSYKKSLLAMSDAGKQDLGNSYVMSGIGSKFNITFELAWKVMKDILVQYYSINNFVTGSPKETLRAAHSAGLIYDERWMAMLTLRNLLSHDYDGEIIRKSCDTIINEYIDLFSDFQHSVETLLCEDKQNLRDLNIWDRVN